jgi:opacity protein-like surface antigen
VAGFSTAVVLCLALAGRAGAQDVTPGQTEVLGFVGGVSDGGGATFGGGVHYAFTSHVLLALEVGYLTGGENFSGPGVDVDSHGLSVDGNLHYLLPSSNPKFTPYILAGIGYVRATASATALGSSYSVSGSDTGVNLGVGGRWRGGSNWGVRPELKLLIADNTSVRFSVAVYREFGK